MTSFNILEKEWITDEGYNAGVYIKHNVINSKLYKSHRLGVIKVDHSSSWYKKNIPNVINFKNNFFSDNRLKTISEKLPSRLNISSHCSWHDDTKWAIGRSADEWIFDDEFIDQEKTYEERGFSLHVSGTIKDLPYFENYLSLLSKYMKELEDHVCKECKRGY